MEAYSKFAEVYDLFMQDIPYEQWCNYITDLLHKPTCPAHLAPP